MSRGNLHCLDSEGGGGRRSCSASWRRGEGKGVEGYRYSSHKTKRLEKNSSGEERNSSLAASGRKKRGTRVRKLSASEGRGKGRCLLVRMESASGFRKKKASRLYKKKKKSRQTRKKGKNPTNPIPPGKAWRREKTSSRLQTNAESRKEKVKQASGTRTHAPHPRRKERERGGGRGVALRHLR